MKTLALLSGAALSAIYVGITLVAQEAPPPKPTAAPAARQKESPPPAAPQASKAPEAAKAVERPARKVDPAVKGDKAAADQPVKESSVPEKYAADEQAIRGIHDALVKAYAADDAKAVAAHFGKEAEYINSQGGIFQGRAEIEQRLSDYMADHPGCQLESQIDAIRFVSPMVALVDGITNVIHEESGPTHCHFAAVYVKADGKWELASVRDRALSPMHLHEDQLGQLDFLLGDWIDEDAHSVVSFSCKATDNGKFLLRAFALKISGQDVMSGSQRIGWDPINEQLRTWIFDSEGGFAEGFWEQSGDDWMLHAIGVTAAGEVASGSSIYKIVDDHTMTWQAVDHEVGGCRMPDSPVYTLTRRAPSPEAQEDQPRVSQKE